MRGFPNKHAVTACCYTPPAGHQAASTEPALLDMPGLTVYTMATAPSSWKHKIVPGIYQQI